MYVLLTLCKLSPAAHTRFNLHCLLRFLPFSTFRLHNSTNFSTFWIFLSTSTVYVALDITVHIQSYTYLAVYLHRDALHLQKLGMQVKTKVWNVIKALKIKVKCNGNVVYQYHFRSFSTNLPTFRATLPVC